VKEFSSQERRRLAGTVLSETKALVFMKALPPGRRRSQQEKSTCPRSDFPFLLRPELEDYVPRVTKDGVGQWET